MQNQEDLEKNKLSLTLLKACYSSLKRECIGSCLNFKNLKNGEILPNEKECLSNCLAQAISALQVSKEINYAFLES
jgi:hypothetical protein